MNYWIFKVADQSRYADARGRRYEYDNVHSVKVRAGDEFLYLEKTAAGYGLTGAGRVTSVTKRQAEPQDGRSGRVVTIFTAHLDDVVWFSERFDLSARTRTGRRNRDAAGLPGDLNRLGWSISMPRIDRELFCGLLDAALRQSLPRREQSEDGQAQCHVDDSWSLVRKRCRMQAFRNAVLTRHNYACVVCGTQLRSVLDAAHIRSYAADPSHRADPSNGICLCAFCHGAFDSGDIGIAPDGTLKVVATLTDEVARMHFAAVPDSQRREWLTGVCCEFLEERMTNLRCEAREKRFDRKQECAEISVGLHPFTA